MSIKDILIGSSEWVAYGEQLYTTPGTYTFTVPSKIKSICALCVGGGAGGGKTTGGGGGALAYANNIAVTPGQQIQVVVGAGGAGHYMSYTIVSYDYMVSSSSYVSYGIVGSNNNYPSSPYSVGQIVNFPAGGGAGSSTMTVDQRVMVPQGNGTYEYLVYSHVFTKEKTYTSPYEIGGTSGGNSSFGTYVVAGGGNANATGGVVITGTGGNGGKGGIISYGSGGGAGGYSGNAGDGGTYPTASSGGAGGSGASGSYAGAGGGGVGLFGQGTTGAAGEGGSEFGKGGSGGDDGQMGGVHSGVGANGGSGGKYGGGGGSSDNTAGSGGNGAVRIIWGTGRSFPSTNVSAS